MPRRSTPPGTPFGPDYQLRALIARHGYTNAVVRDVEQMLARTYQAITRELFTSPLLTDARRARLEAFAAFAQARLSEVSRTASTQVAGAITAAGTVEAAGASAQANQLRASLGLPPRRVLIQAARYDEIVRGLDIGGVGFGDWWQETATSALRRVKTTVQHGILMGENPRTIAAQIVGRSNGRGRSVAGMHLAQWRTAVRTTMTAVQSQASLDALSAMSDIVQRLRFEAVLDARTSDICRALDGEEYDVNDPNIPRPPLHPNCRSALVPSLDTGVEGVRDADADKRRVSYEQWLRAQPKAVQDATLGARRAELWRSTRVGLAELVNTDKSTRTLAELREYLETRPNAIVMVSPNASDEALTIGQAESYMADERTTRLRETAATVYNQLGLERSETAVGIGAWADGAEQTTLTAFRGTVDFDAVRAAASLEGDLADQKAVAVFQPQVAGAGRVYSLKVRGTPQVVYDELQARGIAYQTLVPDGNGFVHVYVLDTGDDPQSLVDTARKVVAYGKERKVTVSAQRGRVEFIGSWDSREDGRREYRKVTRAYFARGGAGGAGGADEPEWVARLRALWSQKPT